MSTDLDIPNIKFGKAAGYMNVGYPVFNLKLKSNGQIMQIKNYFFRKKIFFGFQRSRHGELRRDVSQCEASWWREKRDRAESSPSNLYAAAALKSFWKFLPKNS